MYKKIQKLSKEDQLSIMKREIKLKKLLFCELPPDYPLFRQYNIAPDLMFNNLLALHVVEESNQESISVKNIYKITKSLSLCLSKRGRSGHFLKHRHLRLLILSGHHKKKKLS